MATPYNPANLDKITLLTDDEIERIASFNRQYSLDRLLSVKKNVDALALDFIHASAQIEGNTYDKLDTLNLLELGQTADGKKYSDARMIINLRDAFNMAISRNHELGKTLLLDLHAEICDGELQGADLLGARTGEVFISGSSYVPAVGADYLEGELTYLFEQMQRISNPAEKSIYTHLNLAYLQYFQDGNKRTARMFQTAVMIKYGLIPLLFNEQGARSYMSALIQYYEQGETKPYTSWYMDNYREMFEKLIPVQYPPRQARN